MPLRINALSQLIENIKSDHYYTIVLGWITGFLGFIGLQEYFLDRVVTLIFALFASLLGGFLAAMGKELFTLVVSKYKKWKKQK